MTYWKGTPVTVVVLDVFNGGREVAELERRLDTDTLADILDNYPIDRYAISIVASKLLPGKSPKH